MKLDPDSAMAQAIRTASFTGGDLIFISVDIFSPTTGNKRALILRVDQWSEVRGCRHEPAHLEVVTADVRQELAELDRLASSPPRQR